MEMVQRRAVRWTLNRYSTYERVTEMQNQLGWRSLYQRRADARVIMSYKIVHGLVALPLPSYFEQPARMTRLSHPLALRQIHTTANYYKYSFFPMAVVYWNSIPFSVVTLPKLNQFSAAVRSLDHKRQQNLIFACFFLTSVHDLLTLFFFHKLCTMAARRNPPAHNPLEGAVQ